MSFKEEVYAFVATIPKGRVVTYGQVAAACGRPRAARQVGQIAHWGPSELPWHRVVYADGRLSSSFTGGGLEGHKRALVGDGIEIDNYQVDPRTISGLKW